MASVVIGARESGRAGQARGALVLTATAMLLVDPAVIGDIGFQLSLAATAGLLIWSTTFGEVLRRRLPARTRAVLIDGLGMSLAAQLATQPLVLLHFGQLSLVAPLANCSQRRSWHRRCSPRRRRVGVGGCFRRLAGHFRRAVRSGGCAQPGRADRGRAPLRIPATGQPRAAAALRHPFSDSLPRPP
jgi:hypothetical protein